MTFSLSKCNELIQLSEKKSQWTIVHVEGRRSYKACSIDLDLDLQNDIKHYCKSNLGLNIKNVNTIILKYEVNDFFERHIDHDRYIEFNKDFLYNINVRLNDDFEGGEFWLNDSPHHRSVGEVYHYKSTEWHEVKKVTSGVRYTALFYLRHRDLIGIDDKLI